MRTLLSIAMILVSSAFSCAWADDNDPQLPSDNRIKVLMYDESDVYTITTKYGYQTNIVFAPQEEVETISVGDRSLWQIIPTANRLFIRPMEEDITTNMTVLTNKHSYQFDLKSIAADKSEGNIYVAKFMYKDEKRHPPRMMDAAMAPEAPFGAGPSQPAPAPAAPMPANVPFGTGPSVPDNMHPVTVEPPVAAPPAVYQPAPAAMTQPAPPALTPQVPPAGMPSGIYPNYNYTFGGSDVLAPVQVYDDGKSTYLKYREGHQQLLNIFAVDSTGKETPVRFAAKGEFVLVDAVTGELLVKTADGNVHIYNETLNPR